LPTNTTSSASTIARISSSTRPHQSSRARRGRRGSLSPGWPGRSTTVVAQRARQRPQPRQSNRGVGGRSGHHENSRPAGSGGGELHPTGACVHGGAGEWKVRSRQGFRTPSPHRVLPTRVLVSGRHCPECLGPALVRPALRSNPRFDLRTEGRDAARLSSGGQQLLVLRPLDYAVT
jgi:hypothetical protein